MTAELNSDAVSAHFYVLYMLRLSSRLKSSTRCSNGRGETESEIIKKKKKEADRCPSLVQAAVCSLLFSANVVLPQSPS